MMMTKRLAVTLVVCLALAGAVLAGCSEEAETTTTAAADTTTTAAAGTTTTAAAGEIPDSVKEFYQGKTIRIHCGVPGTVPDLFSRLYGKYLSEELDAKLIVEAYSDIGGLESINIAYKAEPDGLTLGCHDATSIIHNRLLDEPVALYELEDLTFVAGMGASDMALWVKTDGKYDTVQDLQAANDLLLAAASPLGYFAFWGGYASYVLGLDFQTVLGIGGPFDCKLSVVQEETDYCNIMTLEPGLQPDIKPVVMVSFDEDELIPGVPALAEVVDMTDEQIAGLTICSKVTQFMPLVVLPPGVPQERIDYLVDFSNRLATNSDFLAELEETFGFAKLYDGDYIDGEIQYLIENKAELVELKDLVQSYYK